MTAKQARIAASIDSAMQPLIRANKDDVAILAGMSNGAQEAPLADVPLRVYVSGALTTWIVCSPSCPVSP